jgi:hypothetical protein
VSKFYKEDDMVFQIRRASDSFMEAKNIPFFPPYEGSTWDSVSQCWTIHIATPGALMNLKEEIDTPVTIDGDMELPLIVIEDLN